MARFLYQFEWDSVKAKTNIAKHGLDFERSATVFLDPLALTISDNEHDEIETRWITIGRDSTGRYVPVVHTFEWSVDERAIIRVISARRPTRAEVRDYEEQR